jgi:hypothetical protein
MLIRQDVCVLTTQPSFPLSHTDRCRTTFRGELKCVEHNCVQMTYIDRGIRQDMQMAITKVVLTTVLSTTVCR